MKTNQQTFAMPQNYTCYTDSLQEVLNYSMQVISLFLIVAKLKDALTFPANPN
jgi:hypothetical protein